MFSTRADSGINGREMAARHWNNFLVHEKTFFLLASISYYQCVHVQKRIIQRFVQNDWFIFEILVYSSRLWKKARNVQSFNSLISAVRMEFASNSTALYSAYAVRCCTERSAVALWRARDGKSSSKMWMWMFSLKFLIDGAEIRERRIKA